MANRRRSSNTNQPLDWSFLDGDTSSDGLGLENTNTSGTIDWSFLDEDTSSDSLYSQRPGSPFDEIPIPPRPQVEPSALPTASSPSARESLSIRDTALGSIPGAGAFDFGMRLGQDLTTPGGVDAVTKAYQANEELEDSAADFERLMSAQNLLKELGPEEAIRRYEESVRMQAMYQSMEGGSGYNVDPVLAAAAQLARDPSSFDRILQRVGSQRILATAKAGESEQFFKENNTTALRTVSDVVNSAESMYAMVGGAVGAATPVPGGAGMGAAIGSGPIAKIAYDTAYTEARLAGVAEEDARRFAQAMTGLEFAVETASGAIGGKIATTGVKAQVKAQLARWFPEVALKRAAVAGTKTAGIGAVGYAEEASTEALQLATALGAAELADNPEFRNFLRDQAPRLPDGSIDTSAVLATFHRSGLAGFLQSTAVGGPASYISEISSEVEREQKALVATTISNEQLRTGALTQVERARRLSEQMQRDITPVPVATGESALDAALKANTDLFGQPPAAPMSTTDYLNTSPVETSLGRQYEAAGGRLLRPTEMPADPETTPTPRINISSVRDTAVGIAGEQPVGPSSRLSTKEEVAEGEVTQEDVLAKIQGLASTKAGKPAQTMVTQPGKATRKLIRALATERTSDTEAALDLIESGNLIIVEKETDLPDGVQRNRDGWYDPESQKLFLVAENLNTKEARGTAVHEVAHFMSLNAKDGKRSSGLKVMLRGKDEAVASRIEKLASTGNKIAQGALDQASKERQFRLDNGMTQEDADFVYREELIGYFGTDAIATLRGKGVLGTAGQVVRDIVSAYKTTAKKEMGIDNLTENDISYILRRQVQDAKDVTWDTAGKQDGLASIIGQQATRFEQTRMRYPVREYVGPDGKRRIEISDRGAVVTNRDVPRTGTFLGAMLKHDDLFANYDRAIVTPKTKDSPSERFGNLKSVKVQINKELTQGMAYSPEFDTIYVAPSYVDLTDNQFKSQLLHEIQHAIQAREGFAEGDNIMRIFRKEKKVIADKLGVKELPESVEAVAWQRAWNKYQRSYGEAEARLSETNYTMTEQELNETLPEDRFVENYIVDARDPEGSAVNQRLPVKRTTVGYLRSGTVRNRYGEPARPIIGLASIKPAKGGEVSPRLATDMMLDMGYTDDPLLGPDRKKLDDTIKRIVSRYLSRYAGTEADPLRDIVILDDDLTAGVMFGKPTLTWGDAIDVLMLPAKAKLIRDTFKWANLDRYLHEEGVDPRVDDEAVVWGGAPVVITTIRDYEGAGKTLGKVLKEDLGDAGKSFRDDIERAAVGTLLYSEVGSIRWAMPERVRMEFNDYIKHIGDYLTTQVDLADYDKYDMVRLVRESAAFDEAQKKLSEKHTADNDPRITTYIQFPDGWKWVRLDKPGQFSEESNRMGHSVRGYEPEGEGASYSPNDFLIEAMMFIAGSGPGPGVELSPKAIKYVEEFVDRKGELEREIDRVQNELVDKNQEFYKEPEKSTVESRRKRAELGAEIDALHARMDNLTELIEANLHLAWGRISALPEYKQRVAMDDSLADWEEAKRYGATQPGYSHYGFGGWKGIKDGRARIYSLRDPRNKSVVTVEVGNRSTPNKFMAVTQIRGKYNNNPPVETRPKTIDLIRNLLEEGVLDDKDPVAGDINSGLGLEVIYSNRGTEYYNPEADTGNLSDVLRGAPTVRRVEAAGGGDNRGLASVSKRKEAVKSWAKEHYKDEVAPNGRKMWENFVDWFKDSIAVNPDGSPMKLFHGTGMRSPVDFHAFRRGEGEVGIHVGTMAQANDQAFVGNINLNAPMEGTMPRVIPVYIKASNPLYVVEDIFALGPEQVAETLAASIELDQSRETRTEDAKRMRGLIKEFENERLERIRTTDTYEFLEAKAEMQSKQFDAIKDTLMAMGYDSLTYENTAEGIRPSLKMSYARLGYKNAAELDVARGSPFATDVPELSWVLLDPSQIKSVNNAGNFDVADPRMLASVKPPKTKLSESDESVWDSTGASILRTLTSPARGITMKGLNTLDYWRLKSGGYRELAEGYTVRINRAIKAQGIDPEKFEADVNKAENQKDKESRDRALDGLVRSYGVAGREYREGRMLIDKLSKEILGDWATELKKTGRKASKEEINTMNSTIDNLGKYSTRVYLSQIPVTAKAYATSILKQYDKGSGKYYEIVKRAYDYLMTHEIGIPDIAELNARDVETIRRTYQTWIGPGANLTKDDMVGALTAKRNEIGPAQMDAMIKKTIREMLGLDNPDSTSAVARYYRGGTGDDGILQAREKVPKQLRELMGEVTDPAQRILVTVSAQADLLYKNRMLNDFYDNFEGTLWVKPADRAKEGNEKFTEKLSGEDYGPLNGMYVTKPFAYAIKAQRVQLLGLRDALSMAGLDQTLPARVLGGKIATGIGKLSTIQKMSKTALDLGAWQLNAMGSWIALLKNGQVIGTTKASRDALMDAVTLALQNFGVEHKVNKKTNERLAVLLAHGLPDSVFTAELRDSEREFYQKLLNELNKDALTDPRKAWAVALKGTRGIRDTYGLLDSWVKIADFYGLNDALDSYYKANGETVSMEQIHRESADIVKFRNITYSRAPILVQAAERSGGTVFFTFAAEVMRTAITTPLTIKMWLIKAKNAKTAKARNIALGEATKVGMGYATAMAVLPFATHVLLNAMFNGEEDEDKALEERERFLKLWFDTDREQTYYVLGKNEAGGVVLFNASRTDPHGHVTDFVRQAAQSDDPDEYWTNVKALFLSQLGNGWADDAFNLLRNDGPTPSALADSAPGLTDAIGDAFESLEWDREQAERLVRVIDNFTPGSARLVGDKSKTTVVESNKPEDIAMANLMSGIGMRMTVIDPVKIANFEASKFNQTRAEVTTQWNDMMSRENLTREDVVRTALSVYGKEVDASRRLSEVYSGLDTNIAGVNPRRTLQDANVAPEDINDAALGRYRSVILSRSTMQDKYNRQLAAAEKNPELRQRLKKNRALVLSVLGELDINTR